MLSKNRKYKYVQKNVDADENEFFDMIIQFKHLKTFKRFDNEIECAKAVDIFFIRHGYKPPNKLYKKYDK
tara:strand:+ start:193 stop:402 length:210 start_codon:yes stop_codon:yes gene_type:complete